MTNNVHDDVEAYALGALDPDEATVFEDHLHTCERCRSELASFAVVRHALDTIELPPPMRLPPAVGRFGGERKFAPWWRNLAVAASLAIVAGGAFAGGVIRGHAEDAPEVAVSGMVAGAVEDFRADRGGAHLRVLVGPHREQTAIVLAGLPTPSAGRGYQVWINGQSPGMLRRARNGVETLILSGDRVSQAYRIGVSDEPAGGSPKRTTPSIIAVYPHARLAS